MIKGITNYQIREKFDNIEATLESIDKKKGNNIDLSLFIIMTIIAIIGILFYTLYNSIFYAFFTVIGIISMGVLILKMFILKK
jgi:hypothetical protein